SSNPGRPRVRVVVVRREAHRLVHICGSVPSDVGKRSPGQLRAGEASDQSRPTHRFALRVASGRTITNRSVGEAVGVSVVIPWCNRAEIKATLSHNRDKLQAVGAEVVVVNCGGDLATLEALLCTVSFGGLHQVD